MADDEDGKAGAPKDDKQPADDGGADSPDKEHGEDSAAKTEEDGKTEASDGDDDQGKADDKKPSLLSKPWVRVALAVAAVLAVILLIWWITNYRSYGRYQQSTNNAYLAADQVNVAPRVAGYVDQVFVSDNQIVRAGQLLVRIDQRTADSTAAQSRAQIAQAQATVAEARATRTQQFDMIRQAQAQADKSRATLRQQQATDRFNARQVARYAPLSAVGAETNEKYDQNRNSLEQSRAQVAGARADIAASSAQVASARHQIAINDAQIQSGLAQVAASRAQLAANQVDVDAAAVTSRISGRVGDRTVRVGQYVQVGTRMMTVVPVDRLYITANFKETQIGLMRVGQPATIEVDALAGEEIHGVVESFSPGTGSRFAQVPVDNATGNFTKIVQRVAVRIRLDAGPEARRVLVPGLSASVSVDTRGAREDKAATKDEGKRFEDGRQQQHRQELDADRRQRRPGAGQ